MRLIDADALTEQMYNHYEVRNPKQNATMDECCMMVFHAPTIDAVPVVRCHNCKHRVVYPEELGDAYLTCGLEWGISGAVDPMDFCSYGERKDGTE